jgi:phage FluMu protein Com
MSRNSDRLGLSNKPEAAEAPPQMFNPLSFTAPTEFVDLPSKGIGYPKDHPLFGKDSLEIRFMTAKDEDILSNQSLIKKGVALERLLENIIIDRQIDPLTLLIADRNAILIKARGTAYGYDYEATVKCPKCSTTNTMIFNLREPTIKQGMQKEQEIVKINSNGLFQTTLPFSKFTIEFRTANGIEEAKLAQVMISDVKEFKITDQYKDMILSVEGHSDQEIINKFVENMPMNDSTHFKMCLRFASPSIEVKEKMTCKNCSHEEEVQVPFGTDFFWPNF